MQDPARRHIGDNRRGLARSHALELVFLEIGVDPQALRGDDGQKIGAIRHIGADLGGAIDVKTAAGAGTSFQIWLPVSGEISRPGDEAVQALPRGNGDMVMVVDDERALLELAEETLAESGYEPVGFASSPASEAITSMSSPMLPTAITGASVNDFAQPARPRSEPSHSGVQNRRVDTWKRSAPAERSMVTS